MELTDGEKLILVMLSDIHEHLGIENSVDPKLVRSAIHSGNTWGLKWAFTGIFDPSEPSEELVHEVTDILGMWDQLEYAYKNLSPEERTKVDTEAKPFDARFRGFDGNNESSQLSIAMFLIDDLERFADFKGRNLNSHAPSIDGYRRMLTVNPTLAARGFSSLTSTQIVELLNAQRYPKSE